MISQIRARVIAVESLDALGKKNKGYEEINYTPGGISRSTRGRTMFAK